MPVSGRDTAWQVYVCDQCGDITDAHGEPVGCVNRSCDAPAMRLTTVREVREVERLRAALDTLYFELKAGNRDSAIYAMRNLHADVIADLEARRDA